MTTPQHLTIALPSTGVKAPELGHADGGIDARLTVGIHRRGTLGGDFQCEIRRLAHCPWEVQAAWPDGFRINSENEVHVRGNSNVQVAWVVTDERAVIEENVGPGVELSEPGGQQAGDFTYLSILMHVVRQGFVYERVPHITLRDITNNAEIDVIYEEYHEKLEPLRAQLNQALNTEYEEWEMSREPEDWWPDRCHELLEKWWKQRIARQKEIDASIAQHSEQEYLYDKPYEDRRKVRVAGPFTVESITPHRVLGVDENGDVIDGIAENKHGYGAGYDFAEVILENLKRSGVQQAHKEDRISFSSLTPWPGRLVCAEGRYAEGAVDDEGEATGDEKRAAIFVGPEFGTVSRPDLVEAAREAADAQFDVLIACAFNYDAHTTEFERLGRIPVLKARMNADLHMAGELKNTGSGNLFVIFGEPDIDILDAEDGQLRVKVKGVDVYHPNSGEVRSDGPDGIACWFVDTDYNEESFFVRHAYFLGASDPYRSLKTTLRAEIDAEAWESLHSDTSRPFPKPESGRIAVKVINHLGDEVMKVFRVE